MSDHLYEEIDELHRVIERLNAEKESLEAQFDQMVMECFEVVSTTDVDQNDNHIERSVPKHHLMADTIAALEAENERLREEVKGWMDAAFLSDNEAYSTVPVETLKEEMGTLSEENERLRKALEACPLPSAMGNSATHYAKFYDWFNAHVVPALEPKL